MGNKKQPVLSSHPFWRPVTNLKQMLLEALFQRGSIVPLCASSPSLAFVTLHTNSNSGLREHDPTKQTAALNVIISAPEKISYGSLGNVLLVVVRFARLLVILP